MKTSTSQYPNPQLLGRRSLFAALLTLVAFALLPATIHATDYYFSTTGDDNWAGDTAHPKRSVKEANRILNLTDGIHRVFFKRGEQWYDSRVDHIFKVDDVWGTNLTPTGRREIGAWGTGNRPIISSLNKLSSAQQSWTRMPGTSTTWYTTVTGYTDAYRLYVAGVSKLNVRDTVPPQNPPLPPADEYDVDQTYEWFIKPNGQGGAIVYVNTGSTVNWPQNVEVQPASTDPVLYMKNVRYMMVDNVDFRGGSQYYVVHVEAPCQHITFDNNVIKQANHSGLFAGKTSGTANDDHVLNIDILNNEVDKIWTTDENDDARILTGDGIYLAHAVEDGLVKNNQVRDFGHVGITATSYKANFHGVHNIIIEDNEISAINSGYMHGFDVSGFENDCTNVVVRRNYIHDFKAPCHALGNGNKFYSNIFANHKLTTMPRHSGGNPQPFALDIFSFWSRFAQGWVVGHDNIVANNTFYNTEGYAIILGKGSDPEAPNGGISPYEVEGNRIYNNLFLRYGTLSTVADLGVVVSTTIPANQWNLVKNNCFWNSASSTPQSDVVAQYRGQNYTAVQLNGLAECDGNVQVAPVLGNFFDPTSGSPQEVKTGGLDIDSIMGAGFLDLFEEQWLDDGGQTPSIGAIQYYP